MRRELVTEPSGSFRCYGVTVVNAQAAAQKLAEAQSLAARARGRQTAGSQTGRPSLAFPEHTAWRWKCPAPAATHGERFTR